MPRPSVVWWWVVKGQGQYVIFSGWAQCFELTLLVDRQEGHLACNKPVSLMEQLNEKNRGGTSSPRFAWKTNITMEVMVICVNE